MDHLLKSTSNIQIIDLDGNNKDNDKILQAIRGGQIKRPKLFGHHAPSTASLESLKRVDFHNLQRNSRHIGKFLPITVTGVGTRFGVMISGKDDSTKPGKIWSLLHRPFGVPIKAGMRIAIKEPYFSDSPTGDLMVCVHHPTDCVFLQDETTEDQHSLNGALRSNGTMATEPSCRADNIEVRSSSLGGRGVFAKQQITTGETILFEKSLAMSSTADTTAYEPGMENVLNGATTNARKLALLQQLVDRVLPNPALSSKFFRLYAGEEAAPSADGTDNDAVFNTYTALSIIKHNCHTIFPVNASAHHDPHSSPKNSPKLSPSDQRPGIWLQASMFNHSCLPNASWSWIGDLFVVKANRDIASGEEITVAYVPSSYDYDMRQKTLKAANDFECTCVLCKADASAARSAESKEALKKAQRLEAYARGNFLGQKPAISPEELVRKAVTCYSSSHYDGLPFIQLAEPFYQLAHILLGPRQSWRSFNFTPKPADIELHSRAKACFRACVEVALGYRLVVDPETGYCDLLPSAYAHPKPVGVLALMGLAELAYLDGARYYSRALRACAKKLYGIWYGEDATFKKQHGYYLCAKENASEERDVPSKAPSGAEWEAFKERTMGEKVEVPAFLRSDVA